MSRNNSDWGNKPIIVIIGFIASLLTLCTFMTGIGTIRDIIGMPLPKISSPITSSTEPAATSAPSSSLVSSLSWSGRILFVYNNTISELHPNGEVAPLFVAPKDSYSLRWSPDGRHIAYIGHNLDGEDGVYLMDSDGTNARMILPESVLANIADVPIGVVGIDDIHWFFDSKKILIAEKFSGFNVIDIETQVVTQLGECNDRDIWPRTITIDRNDELIGFKDFDSDGIIVRPINDSNCSVWLQADEINNTGPLAFAGESNQIIQLNTRSDTLYRVFEPGTSSSRLIKIGQVSFGNAMAWSPDQRYLAILSAFDIYVLDEVTGSIEKVFSETGFGSTIDILSIGWLP